MKTMEKLSENLYDKISLDFLRNQVLKNAYGNNDTLIAGMDPRMLLVWYLFFGLVPWFVNDLPFLIGCFLLVMATTWLAHVAGLVLALFAVGVFTQPGYLLISEQHTSELQSRFDLVCRLLLENRKHNSPGHSLNDHDITAEHH